MTGATEALRPLVVGREQQQEFISHILFSLSSDDLYYRYSVVDFSL